jgi:hypothetical protein
MSEALQPRFQIRTLRNYIEDVRRYDGLLAGHAGRIPIPPHPPNRPVVKIKSDLLRLLSPEQALGGFFLMWAISGGRLVELTCRLGRFRTFIRRAAGAVLTLLPLFDRRCLGRRLLAPGDWALRLYSP